MSYQVLARKWRPQTFEEVIGQKHVVKTLRNAIANARIAHAFLFTGQRGIGKTTIARILAKALNCQEGPTPEPCGCCTSCREITEGSAMDVLEIDGASNTGVDDVRELRESVKYVPSSGRYKIYIIDEVHMLSNSAFNALLKTLEEPPAHVIFMFATTEPHKIPSTVLSRCQRFDLRRLPPEAIVGQLSAIAAQEHIFISEQGLRSIASEAEGSMRDAQSILDRVISYAGREVRDEDVIEVLGLVDKSVLTRTSQAVLGKDAKECLAIIQDIFHFGYDVRQFYQAMLEHLRNLVIVKISKNPAPLLDLPSQECEVLRAQVKESEVEVLQRLFDIWCKAEEEINRSSQPHIILEMTLLKMVYYKRLLPLDEALAKLSSVETRLLHRKGEGESTHHVSLAPPPPEYREIPGEEREVTKVEEQPPSLTPDVYQGTQDRGWDTFLAFVRKEKPLLAALLDHGRLLHLDQEKIEVGFASQSIFLESAQDAEKKKQLKTIGEKFFGKSMQVNITPLKGGDGIPSPAQGKERVKGGEEVQEKETSKDALIEEALHLFNGKIVEVKKENSG